MGIDRRTILKYLAGAVAGATLPGALSANDAPARVIPWKNWAGNHACTPALRATPRDLDELVSVLKAAKGNVRAVGAGHSWSPLVPTDGTLLSLRRFNGVISEDVASGLVTVGAGTKLSQLGPVLDELGLAMHNLPDIDEQTLAGAFATGTHGTGLGLAALHDAVEALTLVTAAGEVLHCDRNSNADVFEAARVSLGALGIITDYTLKLPQAYRVERRTWLDNLDVALDQGERRARENRHYEFFYLPFSGYSWCYTTNVTDKPITGLQEDGMNALLAPVLEAREKFRLDPAGRRQYLRAMLESVEMPPSFVELPYKTLSTDRTVPIYEMEYQLPLAAGPQAFREIVHFIESQHPEMFIPLEYRYVAADNAWLSEFHQRQSVSISVHRFREGDDPWGIYKTVQDIFLKYEGRPHWGKVHNLGYDDLKALYPRLEDFRRVRAELDPGGLFANAHIREVLAL